MLRKSLFAIALLALVTVTVQADPMEVITNGAAKFDGDWPSHLVYEEVEICTIPIKIDVGYYAEIVDCSKKTITLEQVSCGDIGKGSSDFPCYSGCVDLDIKTNFEAKLGTVLTKDGNVISTSKGQDRWVAYFSDDIIAKGGESTTLCVDAWQADIFYADPDTKPVIGEVAITIKPNL